jgi:dihydroorotase
MSATYDVVIKNGKCAIWSDEKNKYIYEVTDLGLKSGLIKKIGSIPETAGNTVIQAKNLTVIPGAIDTQVHFRDPGYPQKETIASGTRGAIMGGVTSFFEMPNTQPATLSATEVADKMTRAKNTSWANYAFYMGASPANVDNLSGFENLPGVCGIKMFLGSSTGNLVVGGYDNAKKVLQSGKRRVSVHSEDDELLTARKVLLKDHIGDVQFHPIWRNEETALISTKKICELALEAERKIHLLHVTSLEEMNLLAKLKDKKLNNEKWISVEVTPQHLTLSAPECYERLGTYAQMNPPIRSEKHRLALWEALLAGVVDVLGSDHAPHTKEEKAQPYPHSPSGMTGVQTLVPLMLNHVAQKKLSLDQFLDLVCRKPCSIFKIKNKGRLAEGYDADIVLIDEKKTMTITNDWIQSQCGWTPYDGMKVTGWVTTTLVNGNISHQDGELIGSSNARPLEFNN